MVDSSDFETDVGTMDVYARGADPIYVTAPSSLQQEEGVKPLDRLPAQWWNWFLHEATNRFSNYKSYISNALAELDNLLDLSAITPDDTKTKQLKGMFENDYLQKYLPEVVSDASTFAVDASKESSILVSNDDGSNGFDVKKVPYSPCLIYNAQLITAAKTITLPANSPYDGQTFKVVFKTGHNCANASTPMTLNGKPVLVNVNGTLSALPIHTMTEGGGTVYKSLQANTVLDLYYNVNYDGDNNDAFVIIGNPVVLSSTTYTIYADGSKRVDSIQDGNMGMVTSNAVWDKFLKVSGGTCTINSNMNPPPGMTNPISWYKRGCLCVLSYYITTNTIQVQSPWSDVVLATGAPKPMIGYKQWSVCQWGGLNTDFAVSVNANGDVVMIPNAGITTSRQYSGIGCYMYIADE